MADNEGETMLDAIATAMIRAGRDLEFARQLASSEIVNESRAADFGKRTRQIKALMKALEMQSPESRAELESVAASLGLTVSLSDLYRTTNEALDLARIGGKRPLPIRGALQWLLVHYHAQHHQITVTLYGPDEQPNKPSECVKWLSEQMAPLYPKSSEQMIYNRLRQKDMVQFIANLQKPDPFPR